MLVVVGLFGYHQALGSLGPACYQPWTVVASVLCEVFGDCHQLWALVDETYQCWAELATGYPIVCLEAVATGMLGYSRL